MLLKTIFLFIILLISVYLGVHLQRDSGYIILFVNGWTIETSLWIAILFFIVIALLAYTTYCLIHKIYNIPTAISNWRRLVSLHRSQSKTRQGLIEFNEGHWRRAKKNLIDALPNADTPLLNYLTAARAAQEMGDNTQRDNFLRQAQQSMPEAKIAVELTQAQLQIANHQWEQALATLQHLQDLSPQHPYVLKLLLYLYEEIKDWINLINLLPAIKKIKLISDTDFLRKQQHAYLQQLGCFIKQGDPNRIDDFYKEIPKDLRNDASINACFAKYLITKDRHKEAEGILRKQLAREVEDILLELYAKIAPEFVNLNYIESLYKNNKSVTVSLCLGKICMSKKLWGKAEKYLQESIDITPSKDAYVALGLLFEQEHKIAEACRAFRAGALLA